MKTNSEGKTDYDSPWKEILELYFEQFAAFYFPDMHSEIDWASGYQFLDKEFQKVVRAAKTGRRLVDKLVKVWRKDGSETWVLVHVEIQGQVDADFTRRMFQYHYRLFDRYARQIVSLAILTDDKPDWQPHQFGYNLWGCKLQLEFPVIKLLDYNQKRNLLDNSTNPFAVVTLAHLAAQATRRQPQKRFEMKLRIAKLLYQRGFSRQQILELYRFIDWILQLPSELEEKLSQIIDEFEETKKMKYVTHIERIRMKQGLEQGLHLALIENIALGLETKFGKSGNKEFARIKKFENVTLLRLINKALWKVNTLEELRLIYMTELEKPSENVN